MSEYFSCFLNTLYTVQDCCLLFASASFLKIKQKQDAVSYLMSQGKAPDIQVNYKSSNTEIGYG